MLVESSVERTTNHQPRLGIQDKSLRGTNRQVGPPLLAASVMEIHHTNLFFEYEYVDFPNILHGT